MPTYRDNHGIVHMAKFRGSGTWGACGARFMPDEPYRYGWAPEQRVNCVGCLDADPEQDDGDLVVAACSHCGQLWREDGEVLVEMSSQELQNARDGYLGMADGTLTSCKKCRP